MNPWLLVIFAGALLSACAGNGAARQVSTEPSVPDTSGTSNWSDSAKERAGQILQRLDQLPRSLRKDPKWSKDLEHIRADARRLHKGTEDSATTTLALFWMEHWLDFVEHPQTSPPLPLRPDSVAKEPLGPSVLSAEWDWKTLHMSIDSMLDAQDTSGAMVLLSVQTDMRNAPQETIRRMLQLARLQAAAGHTDSALELLERIAVAIPAAAAHIDSAAQLEQQLVNQQKARQSMDLGPIRKTFANLEAAGASYDDIRMLGDSLRSLLPEEDRPALDDRLQNIQQRSRSRAQLLADSARTLALRDAHFAEAREIQADLQSRYPSFSDAFQYGALAVAIDSAEASWNTQREASKNIDPQKKLAEARTALEAHQYLKARDAFLLLQATPYRRDAIEGGEAAAEAYCEDRRRAASDAFAKSRARGVSSAKAEAFLTKAISELDLCLKEFPEAKVAGKVQQNRATLETQRKATGTEP